MLFGPTAKCVRVLRKGPPFDPCVVTPTVSPSIRSRVLFFSFPPQTKVGMNGLGERASGAVRRAVESPAAGPADRGAADEFDAYGDGAPRPQRRRQRQPQPRERRPRGRRRSAGEGDAAASSSAVAGRSPSVPRKREGEATPDSDDDDDDDDYGTDERAARGEVGEYVPPGGSVELGMFGKKVASFHQVI